MTGFSDREHKALLGSFGGWASDAFDYQMFGLALPLMLAVWTLTPGMAGTIVTAALIAASLGGIAGGALSDRLGRLRILRMSICIVALATGACAFVTMPWQMLVARSVQGFGFGAEWSVGAVLLAEAARPDRRGRFLGIMQSAWAVGWALSVLVFLCATTFLPPAQAWRAMFLSGLLPVLLVLWLRRAPAEAPAIHPAADRVSPGMIATRPALSHILLSGLVGLGAHGGYHSVFTWLPTLLRREAAFSTGMMSVVLLVMTLAFGAGCIAAGILSDRLGRRPAIALFSTITILAIVAFLLLARGLVPTLLLSLFVGFGAGGIPAVLGAWFAELFPAAVRGAGVGFAYNAGRIVSAVLPGAIGWGAQMAPLGALIGIAAVASYGLILFVLPLLPETRLTVTADHLA